LCDWTGAVFLAQILDLLQRQGHISYRAIKGRFATDDDYLNYLKAEIIKAQHLAVGEDGEVSVRTGNVGRPILVRGAGGRL
jgi:hypothetical protein